VTTPYIVDRLGAGNYGIYVLVSVVLGYLSFLDLGLGAALTKYVAEHHAAGRLNHVERLVRTALACYLVVGIAGGIVIALGGVLLVEYVLTLGPADAKVARDAFLIAAVGFAVNLPGQTFYAVPAGLQRFDVVVARSILLGSATVGAAVLVLALGYGLVAVLLATLVLTFATALVFFVRTRRLLPEISFRPGFYRPEFRELTGFGVLKSAQRISTQLVFQLDRFVIAAFQPIAAVAYYAVPLSLTQRSLKLVGNVGMAVFPAASALAGRQDTRRIEELYVRAMKLAVLIALPSSAILFVYAHEIMRYWLNADFEARSSSVLMILAVANLLFALTTVPAVTLDGAGGIKASTTFGVVAATVNLGLMLVLVPTIGFEGAAWAVLANALISVPLLLGYVHTRFLDVSAMDLFQRSFARPLVATALLLPVMFWARSLVSSLVMLVLLCVASLLAFVALAVLLRTFDEFDRAAVRSLMRR
jgi:O-antigen/teichoic acid export membrane protein